MADGRHQPGAARQHYCPACNRPVPPDAATCRSCGADFTAPGGWRPEPAGASPGTSRGLQVPQSPLRGLLQGGCLIVLLFAAVGVLALGLALSSTPLNAWPTLVAGAALAVAAWLAVAARSSTVRQIAACAGGALLLILLLVAWAIGNDLAP